MKIKLYLKEWFYNCGLIGFIRILEHNENNFVQIKQNYIEFDSEDLRDFSQYYFKYFFDKYNVAENVINRTQGLFEYIEENIEKGVDDKSQNKEIREKIKLNKKYIKETIKKQLDKIKKIDENIYGEMKLVLDRLDKETSRVEIENIRKVIFKYIQTDHINKRLTSNLFKSILGSKYFGQKSFLNVVNTALTYDEQQRLVYKDYVSNIVEMGFIHDILENKYKIAEIEEHINKDELNITQEIKKIYSNIKKYISKDKSLEDIKKYILDKVIDRCDMCENEYAMLSNYTEGNFIPLAVSGSNMKNFFWNQNAKFPICDICKLILFCIPAGVTSISKTIRENGSYKEKSVLSFVNYDVNIYQLLRTNNSFGESSKKDIKLTNPYSELILNIVEQNKKISRWSLQNIFVAEFEADYSSFVSRIEYFNINRYVLQFFFTYAENTLNKISDYRYKLQIVDYILKDKDIKYINTQKLKDELSEENKYGYNIFIATKIRVLLNLLKKENVSMEDRKKNNDKLYVLYNLGVEIHEKLKASNEENKLNGYTHKMLNSIQSGNKKEFMDTVIRIHIAMEKDVTPIFLEVMQDTDLDFESIGHSFLSGLISNRYEKKSEGE